MRIEGLYKNNGKVTLSVSQEPESYYTDATQGRSFVGRLVKTIYLGDFDVTGLKVGSEIEIYFGEPMMTKNGTFAPVKKIELLKG